MRKKHKRHQIYTILLLCEGDDEYTCALYIRSLIAQINQGKKKISIKNGHGGSSIKLVNLATNERITTDYKKVLVWMDSDREDFREALIIGKEKGIDVIINKPDFESEILELLQKKLNKQHSNKKNFSKHFPNYKLNDKATYEKILPEKIILTIPKTSSLYKIKELMS